MKPAALLKNQVKVNFGKKCLEVRRAENIRLPPEFGNRRRRHSLLQVLAWEVSGEEYGQDSSVSKQNLYYLGIPGSAVSSSIPDNQSSSTINVEYTESWEMLTLTLMMSASLSSLLTLAEMLVQDWDSWRLLVEVEEVAGTERDTREEVRAGPSLSVAPAAGAAGAGAAGVGVGGVGRSLDRVQ